VIMAQEEVCHNLIEADAGIRGTFAPGEDGLLAWPYPPDHSARIRAHSHPCRPPGSPQHRAFRRTLRDALGGPAAPRCFKHPGL
jgi:hypothetical protein